MKRSLAVGFLGVALIIAGMMRADAGDPAKLSIAYVDLQLTLRKTKVGEKARQRLERDQKKKQTELDTKKKELEEFAAQLEKQRAVLKPTVLRQREAELQKRYIELQELYMKLQQDLARQEAELVNEIFGKAAPVIKEIAEKNGYTMVFEKNESAVLFAAPGTDITDEVNRRVDQAK